MGSSFIQLPSDSNNTGKKLLTETMTVGPDTGHMHRTVLSDKTLDQVVAAVAKALAGTYALQVQDFKDGGRAIYSASTAIAGVTTVTTEALLTMVPQRDGTASGTVTAQSVTSGKRLRLTDFVCGCISTGATVLSGRVSLRMHPSAVVVGSPIIATAALSVPAALAQMGDWCVIPIPDDIDFSGTMQFGVSQIFSATSGTVWASLIGFEH